MATVETVRGPVHVDDLGPTFMHEHIFALSTEHMQNYGDGLWWDEDVRVADAVSKLVFCDTRGSRRSWTRPCGALAAAYRASSGSPNRLT